jgi:hypothetical protein
LSTAVETRPAPGPEIVRRGGVLRRLGGLRRTSPGRLQLMVGVLVTLGVLTGIVAGLTGNATRAGTSDLGGRAQPLFVEAETIYAALADADTTAAQAFLAGGLEPADLSKRYSDDLGRATAALSSAARRTAEGSPTAAAVRELSSGVAQYAELVATARADNRQGLPVGASYLAAASRLNRDTLLPRADTLFTLSQREVDDGFGNARSVVWLVLLTLLSVALVVALIASQRYLSRTTHRTFNLRLIAATGLTVVLAFVAGGIFIAQNTHLHKAADDGSTPMKSIAEARILALGVRGDEALALAARGGGANQEKELQALSQRLTARGGPLVNPGYAEVDPQLGRTMQTAATDYQRYADLHSQVHKTDKDGDYDAAVKLAVGPETTTAFESARNGLDTAFAGRKDVFTREIDAAGRGLGAFTVLGPLLALIICALAVAGVRPRLEEYR